MAFTPKEDTSKKQFDFSKWDATKRLDTDAAVDDIPVKDLTFPGMDQGTCGILAGGGGVGKSYLLLQLMIFLATGYDSLGISENTAWSLVRRRKCVYFCFEDRERHIKERIFTVGKKLASLGAPMADLKAAMRSMFFVQTLTGKKAPDFLSEVWQAWLDHVAADAELVVVDTTRKTWNGNENDSGEVNRLLAVFDGFSIRTGCSVLLTVHMNKYAAANGVADTAAATRGSSAFNDNGRANFYLRRMTQDDAKGEKDGSKRNLVDLDRRRLIKTSAADGERADYTSYVMFGGTKASYNEEEEGMWFRRESWSEIGSIEGFGGTLGIAHVAHEGSRKPGYAKSDPGPLTGADLRMLGASKRSVAALDLHMGGSADVGF
jgi:hypothetical protein